MNQQKNLHITNELMEELKRVFGGVAPDDLKKSEFDRGILFGQNQVIKKITAWKEVNDGR
jgi:hypothetical protein